MRKMKGIEAISLYFLFLLSLINIKSVQNKSSNISDIPGDEAKDLIIGKAFKFNPVNNYFKYENLKLGTTILLHIKWKITQNFLIKLKDPGGNIKNIVPSSSYDFEIPLNNTGTYYFSIKGEFYFFDFDNEFTTIIPGEAIDTIDLEKEIYINDIELNPEESYEPIMYKINNLSEDKYVYFEYKNLYGNKINPFEICINEKENCESTIFYHFIKGNKYTIYINFVNIFNSIKFIPSAIIPVLTTTIETKTEGILKNLAPKIYNVDMENKVKYIFFEYYNKILMAPSDFEITKNNLNLIPNLEFTNIDKNNYLIHELSNNTQYWVIIAIPPIFEDKGIATRIAISDYKIENIESEKIIIPSGKSAIIYIPSLD